MNCLTLAALAVSTSILATSPSLAQSYYAREVVAPRKIVNEGPSTGAWETGTWSQWSSTCSEASTRTRSVVCRANGSVSPDQNCSTPRPASSETAPILTGCNYAWEPGTWGAWNSTCSQNATRSRTANCKRSDGADAPSEMCGPSPTFALTETAPVFTSCNHSWNTGEWSTWTSSCSTSATRTRSVTCQRTDGSVADDASCNTEPKPSATETGNFAGCTYSWQVSSYGPWSDTCSKTASRSISYECRRSDGADVVPTFCTSPKPPLNETSNIQTGCSLLPAAVGSMDNTGGWSAQSGVIFTTGPNGTPSARLKSNGPTAAKLEYAFPVINGRSYNIQSQYRGETVNSGCTSSNNVSPVAVWGQTGAMLYEPFAVCPGQSVNKSQTFTANYTGTATLVIWVEAPAGQVSIVWVDNVSINKIP